MVKRVILPLFIMTALFSGCQTKTGTGALTGGALGLGAGALIGGGQGALIGGAVGAVTGGLVGATLDEQDRRIMEQTSPSTVKRMDNGQPITVDDVIELSHGGVSDQTIIDYMKRARTNYNLTQLQINRMRSGGVSGRVIQYMVQTGR